MFDFAIQFSCNANCFEHECFSKYVTSVLSVIPI